MKSTWAVASDRIEFKCFPATQDLYKLGPVPGLCWPLFSYLHETLGVNRRRKWNDIWIGPRMWSVCYWTLAVSESSHPHIFCCLFMWFSWKDSHFSHCSLLNSSFLFYLLLWVQKVCVCLLTERSLMEVFQEPLEEMGPQGHEPAQLHHPITLVWLEEQASLLVGLVNPLPWWLAHSHGDNFTLTCLHSGMALAKG